MEGDRLLVRAMDLLLKSRFKSRQEYSEEINLLARDVFIYLARKAMGNSEGKTVQSYTKPDPRHMKPRKLYKEDVMNYDDPIDTRSAKEIDRFQDEE